MIPYDASRMPSDIPLGYLDENHWRPQPFDCSSFLEDHPGGIMTLWVQPQGAARAFPVALERDGNIFTWTPLDEEITAQQGKLQLMCVDGTDVGKSAVSYWRVGDSIVPGAEHPAAVPSWATQTIERAESAADRAEEAAESIDPDQIEHTIQTAVEAYLDEHPIDAPVTSVNGKTGAVRLNASDVGALPANTPIPAAVTEQTVAGWGFTKNTGTYSKPSGGIPASDLDLVGLGTWLDAAGAIIYTLSLSGTTVTLDKSWLSVYSSLIDSARHTLFVLPIGGTTQNPVVLILSLQKADAQNYTTTLACVYNGNRYSVTLSAASVNASPMTGTLVVEPIVTESDIPTAVSELTNDSGYQTAAQVQSAIAAIPDELPDTTSASANDFLCLNAQKQPIWKTVPSAESNSFGGGS